MEKLGEWDRGLGDGGGEMEPVEDGGGPYEYECEADGL